MDLRLHALGPNYQGKQSLAVFQMEGGKREGYGRVGEQTEMRDWNEASGEKKQAF